ncbi:MAG: hypothetical protein LIR50_07160 [Bacillota bacterium]|nr:hypothetical protein [Bacillota bacterium]
MENEEMLEQTNETENVETQTTEETEEGIELTDTTTAEETKQAEENEEVRKSLKELLKENPELQEEYNNMLKIRLDREDRKHQRELSKYRDTDNVLRTTLNLKEDDDVNSKVREYYESEGVKLPEPIKEGLSKREIERLGLGDADDIIAEGYEAMEDEANRLARIGYQNMNDRERACFNKLAETLTYKKNKTELLKLGATEDLLKDKSFIDFRKQFNNDVPMEKIYDLYNKSTTQKTVKENPGSMKNSNGSVYKDIYTDEEIARLTDEQLDDPKIWEAVRKSMTKNQAKNYYE